MRKFDFLMTLKLWTIILLLTLFASENLTAQTVIDLTSFDDTSILKDTIPGIADGDVIMLKRGMEYDLSSTSLGQSVTIMSAEGDGAPAVLLMGGSSLDITSGSTIDNLKFSDVEIKGDVTAGYLMNFSTDGTITNFILNEVNIHNLRGVFRAKNGGVKTINNFTIQNSRVDSIGGYGVMIMDNAEAYCANVTLSNTLFLNCDQLLRWKTADTLDVNSVTIKDCNFQNTPIGGYIARLDANAIANPVAISNTILGLSNNKLVSGTATFDCTNCYATSDNQLSGFNTAPTAYAGASTDLWVDPTTTGMDFNLQDTDFAGKADAGVKEFRILPPPFVAEDIFFIIHQSTGNVIGADSDQPLSEAADGGDDQAFQFIQVKPEVYLVKNKLGQHLSRLSSSNWSTIYLTTPDEYSEWVVTGDNSSLTLQNKFNVDNIGKGFLQSDDAKSDFKFYCDKTDAGTTGVFSLEEITTGGGSLPEGAVVHWKFEGDVNESLTGTTGEIIDGPEATYIDGPAGKAIDLTGETDTARIVVQETEALKVMNISDASLTLSVLVKFDPAAVGDQEQQEIFMKGSNNHEDGGLGANGTRYEMYAKNGGMYFVIDDDTDKSQLTIDQANFTPNEWNLLTGVRDRENTMLKVYVNGAPAGEMTDLSGAIDTDTIPLILGNYWNKVNKFHGALDEVVVFNRALNPEEVKDMSKAYGLYKPSSNASLSALTVGGTSVDGFFSTTLSYDVELPIGTTDVPTVDYTVADAGASAEITAATSLPGSTTVVVTAEDGATQTYTLNFTVAVPSDDATLSDLAISGTTVDGFASATTSYAVELPAGTTEVPEVTATASDGGAEATVTAAGELPGATTVLVTAEDGSTQTYTINFTVAEDTDPELANEDEDLVSFNLYPNPVSDALNIESVEILSRVEVFNINGKLVKMMDQINAKTASLNMTSLPQGLYLIKAIHIDQSIIERKVVK